jgi:hypothetical protein
VQDLQEMATEAVLYRAEGNRNAFGQIAVELEAALGSRAAHRLIERAERELGIVTPAASAIAVAV